MTETTIVTFETSDGTKLEISKETACLSITLKHMLEDMGDMSTETIIPLPNVTSTTMKKVIQYCEYHKQHPLPVTDEKEKRTDDISDWDSDFCQVEQQQLFDLMMAANYLDIKPLLELTCKVVANMIKGKSVEEIRKTFNIKNDFTPEEEEKVKKEFEWIEEK